MITKFAIALAGAVMLVSFPIPAQAYKCSGNACDAVVFSVSNGCFYAKNMSARRVKVKMGPYGFVLQNGERKRVLGLGGKCFTIYPGSNTANYEN